MLISSFFPKVPMHISESSYFILEIEELFGFLFEQHEIFWDHLPQCKFRFQLFYLKVVEPKSWL